jgi:phosphomannomutase
VVAKADYAFGENGCVGLRKGQQFHEESVSQALGEETLKRFINFCLHYIADLDIPIKRGTFIEYRKGMLNVSPIGRNCSQHERDEFVEYDNHHKIRETFRQVLTENFGPIGMQFSIGGQISIDAFPTGWDKTHCLRHLEEYEDIYFFGDRTEPGGNDYELYIHPRVKSFHVTGPEDTQQKVTELLKELESRLG